MSLSWSQVSRDKKVVQKDLVLIGPSGGEIKLYFLYIYMRYFVQIKLFLLFHIFLHSEKKVALGSENLSIMIYEKRNKWHDL